MPGEDFLSKWLPLILTGGSIAGSVIGAKTQAGASDRAAELEAQTAQKQLDAALMLYGTNRNDLAPYRAVGTNALAALQSFNPNDRNRTLPPVDFNKFKPDQISLPGGLARLGSPGLGGNALVGGGGGGPVNFSDIPTSGISGGNALGRIAGGAAAGAGLGSVLPVFGTAAGAAGGALVGGLRSLFDNNNADKNFATTGINRVSDWTWNSLMPAVRSGQITPDEAEAQFNNVWGQWEQSMRGTPNFNTGVLDRSIASQKQYFQPFFTELNQLRTTSRG